MALYLDFDPAAPPPTWPDDRVVVVDAADADAFALAAGPDVPAVAVGDAPGLPSVPERGEGFDEAVDDALAADAALEVEPAVRAALATVRADALPSGLAASLPRALAARAEARPAFVAALISAAAGQIKSESALGLGYGLGRALFDDVRGALSERASTALLSVASNRIVAGVLADLARDDAFVSVLRFTLNPSASGPPTPPPDDVPPFVWALTQSGMDRRSLAAPNRGAGGNADAPTSDTFVNDKGLQVRVEVDPDTGDVTVGPVRRPGERALESIVVEIHRGGRVFWRLRGGARVDVPATVIADGGEFVVLEAPADR